MQSRPYRGIPAAAFLGMGRRNHAGVCPRAVTPKPVSARLSSARIDLFLLTLLPALRHSIPRRDVDLQHLLREVGPWNVETGAMGRTRCAARPGEILRRKDIRGVHVEAHIGLL